MCTLLKENRLKEKKMKNILVTAIGSASADIVIAELKNNGHKVVGCDINQAELIANSLDVDVFYKSPLAYKIEEYLSFIKNICVDEKIDFIFPLTDVEIDVYNNNREWFEEKGIVVCMSSYKTISLCRNKKKLEEYLRDKDCVTTIPTYLLSEMQTVPDKYPVVCKPFNGRSSEGLTYIYNSEEWEAFKKSAEIGNFIVQPYIAGRIITVDIVRQKNGEKTIAIPREELLRSLNGLGMSVKVFTDEKLETQCTKLADELDINGCVNFEFIKDEEGEYHFIECNPRFSGGLKFSCLWGYNCIINHLRVFENGSINEKNTNPDVFIARKYCEKITLVEE